MKIYISGKMRGLPEEESRMKFEAARQYLIELGHDVVNPWDSEKEKEEQCLEWEDYILYDLRIIKHCDVLFMLDNWRDSDGAKCEHAFASGRGMEILYEVHESDDSDFYNGIWCCVQDLVAVYCEPTLATDILRSSGMTVAQMRRAQENSGSYESKMYEFINSYKSNLSK